MMKRIDAKLLEKNIYEIANYDLNENNIFGSSYMVCQEGKTVFKGHFGRVNPETGAPVDDNTIFRLASMTKPVTAVAMLILVQRGLISLDDQVKKYVPEFDGIHVISKDGVDYGAARNDATIKHLLTHTSGFASGKPVVMTENDMVDIQSTVSFFVRAGLDFEPFSQTAYSGTGAFDVLALIAERVTGEDFGELLNKEIFVPCKMADTTFAPSTEQWERVISMHCKVDGKNGVSDTYKGCVFEQFPQTHKLAGAGLASTLCDYSRFAGMLLNNGRAGDIQIISEDVFSLMHIPYVPESIMPGNESWGLGVRVITKEEYEILPVGTYGWSGAYGSHFWIDPENKVTAVFMKNSRFDGGSGNKSAVRFEQAVHKSFV